MAVVAWRLAVLGRAALSPQADGVGTVEVLLALVGLAFVACGLLVARRRPDRAGLLFAAWCLCAGLHWGGPLELAAGPLRKGLLFLYLLLGSLLGEALFLHFALSFPRRTAAVGRRLTGLALYAPAVGGALLAAAALAAPAGGGLAGLGQQGFLLLHAGVSNLFPVLALLLYLSYLVRPVREPRLRGTVGLLVAAMLLAWLPYVAASAYGLETDPFNLAMVVLPLAFSYALLRRGGGSRGGGSPG